jgi:hypothetical protein
MSLTDPTIQSAANALLLSLTTSGCQQASDPTVQAFQMAYISNGGGSLPASSTAANGVDGLYGTDTQAALQAALNAGPIQPPPQAPAGCVGAAPSGGGGGTIAPIVVTGSPAPNYMPWVLGGLVVVAGSFAAYTYSKKHRRGKHR